MIVCGLMPTFLLILVLSSLGSPGPTDSAAVVGTWEGESNCTVPNSPCHDEHALYKFTSDKKDPAKISLDAYKVVNGTPEFMGTIACDYAAADSKLSCTANTPKQDLWEFVISANTMTGTLRVGPEKTLYRRITLHRSPPKRK